MRPSSQPPSLWAAQNKQLQRLKKYGMGWEKIVLFSKCHSLLRTELCAFFFVSAVQLSIINFVMRLREKKIPKCGDLEVDSMFLHL